MYWSAFLDAFTEIRDRFLAESNPRLWDMVKTFALLPSTVAIKNLRPVFPGEMLTVNLTVKNVHPGFQVNTEFVRKDETVAIVSQVLLSRMDILAKLGKNVIIDHYYALPFFASTVSVDASQHVHPMQYAYWLGRAREQFISENVPQMTEMIRKGILIITTETTFNLFGSASLGDIVEARICVAEVRRVSCVLRCEFVKADESSEELVAVAAQKLVFAEIRNDKITMCAIPAIFLEVGKQYALSRVYRAISNVLSSVVNQ